MGRCLQLARQSLGAGDADAARQLLDGMAAGLDRVNEIIVQFESFRRAGCFPLRPQAVEVVLDECLAMLQDKLSAAGCVVVTDVVRPLPAVYAGNLFQVFANIIQNAAQAMPDGGRVVITARLETDGANHGPEVAHPAARGCHGMSVTVRFADSGPGFGPRPARLFEPYVTTGGRQESQGLGLAICREIVQQSGGRIAAETRPEGGGLVTVVLPAVED